MALEIERRFLVRSDHAVWSSNSVRIVQGYIPQSDGGNLRVRIAGDTACLTIKRHVASGVRNEHNMPLTVTVASALLRTRCTGGIVEKVRHTLVIGGRTWEVDVFEGDNEGLTIAEIELDYVGQPFQLPLWVGPQGRRMKSAGQKSEHVLVIPGGLLATRPHADPGCSVPAHEVDGDLAQDSQVAGRLE